MTETPLDRAHDAMQAEPGDDAARLRFYERLADAELFLLLDAEAEGDRSNPAPSTSTRHASCWSSTARIG